MFESNANKTKTQNVPKFTFIQMNSALKLFWPCHRISFHRFTTTLLVFCIEFDHFVFHFTLQLPLPLSVTFDLLLAIEISSNKFNEGRILSHSIENCNDDMCFKVVDTHFEVLLVFIQQRWNHSLAFIGIHWTISNQIDFEQLTFSHGKLIEKKKHIR